MGVPVKGQHMEVSQVVQAVVKKVLVEMVEMVVAEKSLQPL